MADPKPAPRPTAQYESDRIDFLTLLENQRTLLSEQLDYFRVLGDLADARADLERAIGIDLDLAYRQ